MRFFRIYFHQTDLPGDVIPHFSKIFSKYRGVTVCEHFFHATQGFHEQQEQKLDSMQKH